MTQEEKAKAYDEALERARKLYNDAKANEYKSDMEDYESIFPELAESEDERIRKCLCDIVNWLGFDSSFFLCNGVAKTDVLAYLEKQKDINCLACDQHLKGYLAGRKVTEEEKQKEQNSVDEQFPPLNGLDAIKAKYYDDGFKNGFDEGVASVKPAEWSEEDETYLQDVLWCVKQAYKLCKTENDTGTCWSAEKWLKSLKLRMQ